MRGKSIAFLLFVLCLGGLSLLQCTPPTPEDIAALDAGRGVASFMTAKSLSNHYVEVAFEGPMDATYGLPETYKIVSAVDDAPLAVRAAQLRTDGTTALLTTDAQAKID